MATDPTSHAPVPGDGLAGKVEMQIQGQPTLTLHTGDPFLIPPRTPHNALDLGPETGQMLSVYLVEVGAPPVRS